MRRRRCCADVTNTEGTVSNIFSRYTSQHIYRAGYVLVFKRGCYWIMNVLKRPKFRMRGEHYFRQGSNNFVRFYITTPPAPSSPSAGTARRLQRVPHVEKCIRSTVATRTTYVSARSRLVFVASCEISFVIRESNFCARRARDARVFLSLIACAHFEKIILRQTL